MHYRLDVSFRPNCSSQGSCSTCRPLLPFWSVDTSSTKSGGKWWRYVGSRGGQNCHDQLYTFSLFLSKRESPDSLRSVVVCLDVLKSVLRLSLLASVSVRIAVRAIVEEV